MPASETVEHRLWRDSSGDLAECRGGRKHVVIWDAKPGASRNAVVRLGQRSLRLSNKVLLKMPLASRLHWTSG